MVKKFKSLAMAAVLSLMMVTGVVVATTVPAAATGSGCKPGVQQPCAFVWTRNHPQPDCKVYMRFYNPDNTTILRSVAVFHDGHEVFGDDDFIGQGLTPSLGNPPMIFGPLEDGEWRILVTSGNIVMADKTFDFSCGL